jgi:four helix bundle protein
MENQQERPITFFRFEDLRVYHKSLDYITWMISHASESHKDPYQKLIFERIVAAASGISMNIAEGSSRNKSQFVYYLKMAKSSVRECVVLTTVARQRNYLSEELFETSKTQLMEMTKMIGALIGSLQRSIKGEDIVDETDDLD